MISMIYIGTDVLAQELMPNCFEAALPAGRCADERASERAFPVMTRPL
jgi:hypothetical protein